MLLQNQPTTLVPTAVSLKPKLSALPAITSRFPSHRHDISCLSGDSQSLSLDIALNNQTMTAYLRSRLPQLAPAHNMTVSSSHLLDCKPGKRALVRYEVTTPHQDAKTIVFGKIYSQSDQLMRVDQVMDALWFDVFGDDSMGSTPQPLGVIPELFMYLYLPAEGKFLDKVLSGKRAADAMKLTARWLSTLHAHSLQLTKRFDLVNELKNLAAWTELVSQTYPEMIALVYELLNYLQRQAPMVLFATETPIHKDFHYRHVLVGRGVKVIDFDEVRLGDPNFDLAHFCANLHLLAYRQHGSPHCFYALERNFLRTYAQRVGQPWASFAQANREQFRYFYIYTCIKIARQLCLGFGPSPVPTADQRRRQVQMILKQGEKQL